MSTQYDEGDEGSHEPGTNDADWLESVFMH
jgi:hypothetical protein